MTDEVLKEKVKYKNPLSRHVLWMCLFFTVVLCVIMGIIGYFVFEKQMMGQYELNLTDVLELTISQIDVDDLDECIKTQTKSEKFEAMTEFMNDVREHYELDHLVISKPVLEGDTYDVMQVVSGLNEAERNGALLNDIPVPQLGDRFGAMMPPELLPVLYQNFYQSTEISYTKGTTDFGATYAAAKTIRNDKGDPVAQISAGLSLAYIENAKTEFIKIILFAGSILCIAFITFTLLWLRRRIIDPLSAIEAAASEFEEKSHNQNDPDVLVMDIPEIHTGDELESLSNTLSSMSLSMRNYVENLLESSRQVSNLKKDLVDSKKKAMQFSEMATKDALTGIRNKTAYDKEVEKIVADMQSGNDKFGVVMVDLNYLKKINDEYGHEKGNIAIQNLCKLVCTVFDHSPVFRIGGDEFVAILRGEDYKNINFLIDVFNNKLDDLQADATLKPWDKTSAAIGYALFDGALDLTYDDVFKRADAAMYERKKAMKANRTD